MGEGQVRLNSKNAWIMRVPFTKPRKNAVARRGVLAKPRKNALILCAFQQTTCICNPREAPNGPKRPLPSLHFYVVWRKRPSGDYVKMHVSNLAPSPDHVKKVLRERVVFPSVLFYVVR